MLGCVVTGLWAATVMALPVVAKLRLEYHGAGSDGFTGHAARCHLEISGGFPAKLLACYGNYKELAK
jgi:hypothetical protein